MAKKWTEEELGAANVALWERFNELPVTKHADIQTLQCELTEAAEIIGELSRKAESDIWPSEADAWLARNRKEDA